jgi:methyl coenzyme M reductase alpha subunit
MLHQTFARKFSQIESAFERAPSVASGPVFRPQSWQGPETTGEATQASATIRWVALVAITACISLLLCFGVLAAMIFVLISRHPNAVNKAEMLPVETAMRSVALDPGAVDFSTVAGPDFAPLSPPPATGPMR